MDPLEWQSALQFAARHQTDRLEIGSTIEIGGAAELSDQEIANLRRLLDALGPYRKGPFSFFGQSVASHWNSDAKWNRILPYLETDERVASGRLLDLGCNNGYYLLRMLELRQRIKKSGPGSIGHASQKPLIGIDPAPSFYRQFHFLQSLLNAEMDAAQIPFLQGDHRILGETADTSEFDAICCWGVIYHLTDPIELLRSIHGGLKTGGVLYLESMGLADDPDHPYAQAIVPESKYAGARGIWLVPNSAALANLLHRSGFRDVEFLTSWDYTDELNPANGLPVLSEFLDPARPGFLSAGFPAPIRILMRARR